MDFSLDSNTNRQAKLFSFPMGEEDNYVLKISVNKNSVDSVELTGERGLLRVIVVVYGKDDRIVETNIDMKGLVVNGAPSSVSALVGFTPEMAQVIPLSGWSKQFSGNKVDVYLFKGTTSFVIQGTVTVTKGVVIEDTETSRFVLAEDSVLLSPNCGAIVDIPHGAKTFHATVFNGLTTIIPSNQFIRQVAPSNIILDVALMSDGEIEINSDALVLMITPTELNSDNVNARGQVVFKVVK